MLFCCECARRVYSRKGCPKHPMAEVERVPPLDGFLWFGNAYESAFNRGQSREENIDSPVDLGARSVV